MNQQALPVQIIRAPQDFDFARSVQAALAEHVADCLNNVDNCLQNAGDASDFKLTPPVDKDSPVCVPAQTAVCAPAESSRKKKRKPRKSSARRKRGTVAASAAGESSAAAQKINMANTRRSTRRIAQRGETGHKVSEKVRAKYVNKAKAVAIDQDSFTLPATAGGYSAKNTSQAPLGERPREEHTKEELVSLYGFTSMEWNGIEPMVIVDSCNRSIAALAGRPPDASYMNSANAAHQLFLEEHRSLGLPDKVAPHARGHFSVINAGAMHGKGTLNPINLNLKKNGPVVERLIKNPHVRRLAAFASYSLSAYAPKLYDFAHSKLRELYAQSPKLERLFPAHISIFPTAAFNLGPRVWTYKHRDTQNLAYGWCAIQALGNFDHTRGGHLVLWELRLVIEFPAGSLILIPSATITHSNTPVAEDETRTSFTQYMPGGLFRWVDFGHSLVEDCKNKNPALYAQQMMAQPLKWRVGLDLLTVIPPQVDQ